MNNIESATSCRICTLTRAAWYGLRLALLPRTFAFIAALTVLALMAPSSMPPFLPRAKPKAEAPPTQASSAAPASAAASTAESAVPSTAKGAAPAPAPGSIAEPAQRPAGPAASAVADAPKWRFRSGGLPYPVVGQPWEPQQMLERGAPPFKMSFENRSPELAWISLDPETGTLTGEPTKAGGPWTFELKLEPTGKPDQFISQKFSVKVLGPAAPSRLAAAASSPRVTQPASKPDLPGGPFTYRLEGGDPKAVAEAADPMTSDALKTRIEQLQEGRAAITDPAEMAKLDALASMTERAKRDSEDLQPKQPKVRHPDGLEQILSPLLDIDYPTEHHFRNVLELALCKHYPTPSRPTALAGARNLRNGHAAAGDTACPGLPEDAGRLIDHVVKRARKPHPYNPELVFPWSAKPGCGCVPPNAEDEVYGFVSHWGTAEQQQEAQKAVAAAASAAQSPAAGKKTPVKMPREIDFSLFTRISFFGATLNDEGAVELPRRVAEQGHELVGEAQRHGTRVDLVIHRRNWGSFLNGKAPAQLAARAADSAIRLLDDRRPGVWQHLLLPFWREETFAYGGITVFFDNVPDDNSAQAGPFREFRRAFLEGLIGRMQASGRSYRLNILVPAEHVAETGLRTFGDMTRLIELAEPVRTSKKVDAKEKEGLYKGKTDITVTYLVLLPDPTTDSKKDLRERIDRSEDPKGSRRVALLESLVPVLLRPPAITPPWGKQPPAEQFKDDLAYMKWNYSGVALWELPAQAKGDEDRLDNLKSIYRNDTRRLPTLCDGVCPQRLWLRVLLQALAVVGAVAIPLWFFNCAVRGWGWPYKIFLWAGGIVTVSLALALHECDPALHEMKESGLALIALVALLLLGGLYWSFKARGPRP